MVLLRGEPVVQRAFNSPSTSRYLTCSLLPNLANLANILS
jgi:hypothetical protein